MRRKDKEITDREQMEAVLTRAEVACIAFSKDNEPYVIPMNFAYREGILYFHSAREGTKLDMLRANPRVCVAAAVDVALVRGDRPCDFSARYRSVICRGRAAEIEGTAAKEEALRMITKKYAGQEIPGALKADPVTVIAVTVEEMTGKKSGC
jgi:hypothetical protein